MATGEEAVVGVVGGVEQVLAVELLKDEGVEQHDRGLRVAGVGLVVAVKAGDGARVILDVKVVVGLAHGGVVIHGVGVDGGGQGAGGDEDQRDDGGNGADGGHFPSPCVWTVQRPPELLR